MANNMIVMTKDNLQFLAQEILQAAEDKIAARMVTTVNDQSDDLHVPTAKAVNAKVKAVQKIVYLTIASGDPNEADITPEENILYAVRTAADDEQYVPYLWIEAQGTFIPAVGAVTEDSADLSAVTQEDISTAVALAASATAVV